MKTYVDFNTAAKELGFILLTGESDKHSRRLLFDITPEGRKLFTKFFGLVDAKFPENWNSSEGQDGSVMIPWSFMQRFLQEMWMYKMRQEGLWVLGYWVNPREGDACPDELIAGTKEEMEQSAEHVKAIAGDQIMLLPSVTGGDRNLHHFSGRTT